MRVVVTVFECGVCVWGLVADTERPRGPLPRCVRRGLLSGRHDEWMVERCPRQHCWILKSGFYRR